MITRRREPRRLVRWLYAVISILAALALAEVLARGLWYARYGVPFAHPGRVLYAVYPELRLVDEARPGHDDGYYDVLLLGGSTLHRDWGEVEQELRRQLRPPQGRQIRIFNLAKPAHSSRDSLLKYQAVGDARFEAVVVYDGINEARVNNVPPELYRGDYSHYAWYEVTNALAPYHGHAFIALPYTAVTLAIWMKQAVLVNRYVPRLPRPDWMKYGGDIRSAASFEANLDRIATLARTRGDHLIVMTFAAYMPAGYSLEAFREKRLDYAGHREPIETWGEPRNVMAAVARHNEVLRALTAARPDVSLVDQDVLMPRAGRYFDDVCHFTAEGSRIFVRNLVEHWPPI
jgi:hypothetical protein